MLWLMRSAGVVSVLANTAYLLGLPGSPLIGPGVALLAVALLALSVALYSSAPYVIKGMRSHAEAA